MEENLALNYINQNQNQNEDKNQQNYEENVDNIFVSSNPGIKKEKKRKGFVRVFRNFIKKKDRLRKSIILKRFKKWLKHTLKNSLIKETIMIRISVSKDKNVKPKYNNIKININDDGKCKSVNKKIVKSVKNFTEKENINKNINQQKINLITKNKDNNNYIIAKRINNYRGNDDYKNISHIPKNNINHNNNNFIKIDNRKIQNNRITNKGINQNKNIDNKRIIITSSSTNNRNISSLNNNYNNNYKSNNTTQISKDKNISNVPKVLPIRHDGYRNNRKINAIIPNHALTTSANDSKEKQQKEHKPYEVKKNYIYNREKTDNFNFIPTNIDNNETNSYKINTYQNIKDKNKYNDNNYNNNVKKNFSYASSRRESNTSYSQLSQKTSKTTLKGGVTTVIQHYSGKRRQYNEYDKKSLKK